MNQRVLVVGFDGVGYPFMSQLIAQGIVPNLADFAAHGVQGPLTTVLPTQSLPAWPSFATGMNPGKHGVYHFYKLDGYNLRPCSSEDLRGMAVWDYLSSLGKRVFVVNVPLTFPPYDVNGIMVSGFPAPPGSDGIDGLQCFPHDLKKKLLEIAPDYKMEPLMGNWVRGLATDDQILERIHETLDARKRLILHLMDDASWDVFFTVFTCSDRILHWFWRHHDPTHPASTPDGRAKYGHAIRDFFRELDAILGIMLTKAGENTTTFVISDHGHSPQIAHVGVNELLADIGVLKYDFWHRLGLTKPRLQAIVSTLGLETVAKSLPKKVRSAVPIGADFSQSKAYYCWFGAINVNLKGRDPTGIVEKEDYDKVRDELTQLLINYKDPETGQLIVDKVYRREEIYSGNFLESAPDILAVFHDGYGPQTINSNGRPIQRIDASVFDLSKPVTETSGHHWFSNIDGIFYGRGPSIRAGATVRGARLIDVVPTLLHLLSIPIPKNMDGKVLDVFAQGSEPFRRPIEYSGTISTSVSKTSPWSVEEEQAVMKRLADLGYMG